ncbi:hypothetical protein SLH46_05620 [Draconibacterium sp. IB214405]|uniref:hypothetical protein n=1 Tax=Draconibacterium sp. IB214405 TaxID=3097352 RepID=UPI002A0D1841|nr:hypothetical protein [Draconibacterium sp. IB214405]MDX8338650.1 hypothetical protein [Draconibacterium sp. IB214405]
MDLTQIPTNLAINDMHRIGYIYYQQGIRDTAAYYFQLQEQACLEAIESGRFYSNFLHYDLAGFYAFYGEKEQAYLWLNKLTRQVNMPIWLVDLIKIDPLFDKMRGETEFENIVADVETKYQNEQERVKIWLENNNIRLE